MLNLSLAVIVQKSPSLNRSRLNPFLHNAGCASRLRIAGNEMADGLAFLGSQGTCYGTQWMKDALKEVRKKATEIGMVEPRPEFSTCAALGMDGFSRYPDHCSRKSYWPWETASVGLPYNEESFREIRDEVKRRKKELNSMRSDFNAYRWRARTEWANKKVF